MQSIKTEIIKEYNKLLNALYMGKEYNYSKIIDMINFVEVRDYLTRPEYTETYLINK